MLKYQLRIDISRMINAYRYKKLALKHHPLKNPADMAINLEKFNEICEAYEVLSNRTYLFITFFSSIENYLRSIW